MSEYEDIMSEYEETARRIEEAWGQAEDRIKMLTQIKGRLDSKTAEFKTSDGESAQQNDFVIKDPSTGRDRPMGVAQASLIELRYSGRQLRSALPKIIRLQKSAEQPEISDLNDVRKCLIDAEGACIRAKNDAIDALAMLCQKLLDMYSREYGLKLLRQCLRDIDDSYELVVSVSHEIRESRRQDVSEREVRYNDIGDTRLEKMSHLADQLCGQDGRLKDLRDDRDREEREKRLHLSLIVVSILFSLFALVQVVLFS